MPKTLYLDTSEGIVEHLIFDESERRNIVKRTSDITANIEHNKAEYQSRRQGREGLGEKVASIPLGVVLEWKEKYGVDIFDRNHQPAVTRLLNDPDYLYLRTAPGRL